MINLHCHSMFSLRDSIIKPDDLVKRLQEINQNAVAITDHGGSLGGVYIYKKLKEANIKYIHGCEMYICDNTAIKDKESKYNHLVVLCKNEVGRHNLNILISKSEHPDNKYYKPRIDFEMLKQNSEGLIITSACMAGEISRYLENNEYEKAKYIAEMYKNTFGNDYYLEVQSHRDEKQIELNKKLYQLSIDIGIKCIVTCDTHYTWEEDKEYQNKYAFNGSYKEDGEAYVDCFIQSEEQVRERITYFSKDVIDKLINNTHEISDKCNVEMPLSAPIMPRVDTPAKFKTNREWLESICEDGFKNKLHIDTLPQEEQKIYRERYEYEVDSLYRMGFIDYILLVYSYANIAKRRGIARGSGGGSLVCYLSNITNIDPIEHGLYFERFIDVGALSLLESGKITAKELKIPDIDLDFSGDSCKDVLRFLYNKYGEENVASIGKFGNNLTKGTIRDMCKVLDIDLKTEDEIAKAFELYEINEIDTLVAAGEKIPDSAKLAIQYINQYQVLFDYVRKLNGLPKSFGLHACGKVISTRPLDEFLPSCYDTDGVRYLQGDMHDVEDVGLVKIDVLGLRTLDQEYDTLEMSGNDIEYINPKNQNYSDPKVLDIFKNGDTVGIFQMASYGMRDTLKKMDINSIEDLSIANALYRPGAMAYIDSFCKRRKGLESFEYLHPDLEPILKNTYGIIVFQEQLIEIGRMAKIHNPDMLRKATGKKDIKLLNKVKPELENKLKERGWNDIQFNTLWTDMIEFSKYSFNKCVSGNTRLKRAGQQTNSFAPTIEEMFKIKNDVEYAKRYGHNELHQKYKHLGYGNALSMYDDYRIRKNKIVNIYFSGTRQTYKITTKTGKTIVCTENHKFPTPDGIKFLSQLHIGDSLYILGNYEKCKNKYNLTDGNYVKNLPSKGQCGFQNIDDGSSVVFEAEKQKHRNSQDCCEICSKSYDGITRFELHHKDNDRTNNSIENYQWLCASCHKKVHYKLNRVKVYEKGIPSNVEIITSIIPWEIENVYDVEMADPAHTFVIDNGIVTSNSHSSAYGILAYITAKQKAYYPKEFYAGLYNSYIGKSSYVKDDSEKIAEDMIMHKINLYPFSFRNDHRKCSIKDNKIIYAIPLIRDCNENLSNCLYELKDTQYKYFWQILKDIYFHKCTKTQVSILIKLDFFSEYGNAKQLLRIADIYEFFKQGTAKEINKEKLSGCDFLINIIREHATDIGNKGDILKSYKIIDMEKILNGCEEYVLSLEIRDFDFKNKIQDRKEYLGFPYLVTEKEEDRPILYVKETYPLKRKKDNKQFGYSVIARSLGSGRETRYTVFNKVYKIEPVVSGDIIRCKKYTHDGQYFTMDAYEKVF